MLTAEDHFKPGRQLLQQSVDIRIPYIFEGLLMFGEFPGIDEGDVEFVRWHLELLLGVEHQTRWFNVQAVPTMNQVIREKITKLSLITTPSAQLLVYHLQMVTATLQHQFVAKASSSEAPDGIGWYKACACYEQCCERSSYDNEALATLVTCAAKQTPGAMRQGVLSIILTVVKRHQPLDYIAEDTLRNLSNIFPDQFSGADGILRLDTMTAKCRHDFNMAQRVNTDYFKAIDSPLMAEDPKAPRTLSVRLHIPKSNSIFDETSDVQIQLNAFELLKFCSHMQMLAFPIPLMGAVKNVPLASHEKLNDWLHTKLKEAGFLNSEGMFNKARVFVGGKPTACSEPFLDCYMEALISFEHNGITLNLPADMRHFIADTTVKTYQKMMAARSKLDLFHQLHAVGLLCSAYGHIAPDSELHITMQRCYQLAAKVDSIARPKADSPTMTDPKKHVAYFAIADQVVDDFARNHRPIVIQVGTPIKIDKGEKHSTHAFYIGIKVTESGIARAFIVNGGPGLSFHQPDETLAPSEFIDKEYGAYHPVCSTPIKLNSEGQTFLKHYVYQAICLRYKPFTKGQMGNVYLQSKNPGEVFCFQGYKGRMFPGYASEVYPSVFRAQLNENCTIFNFKRMLRIMFDMDEIRFGEFEDRCMQAADTLVTHALAPASAMSAGSAAVAAGESGAGGVFSAGPEEIEGVDPYVISDTNPAPAMAVFGGVGDGAHKADRPYSPT